MNSDFDTMFKIVFDIPLKDIDDNYIALSPTAIEAIKKIMAEKKFNRELFTPLGLCNIFPTLKRY